MSRYTSKRHKKKKNEQQKQSWFGKDDDDDQSQTRRQQRQQLGEGVGTVIAGLPKAAWKITKGLETLAKKNAKKAHLKRMAEIKRGKRKRYAGESLNCNIM